jgi:prepilin-type N-terminal cleavage/methylation domain-containing protein
VSKRGLTLAELVVSLSIVGAVAALVAVATAPQRRADRERKAVASAYAIRSAQGGYRAAHGGNWWTADVCGLAFSVPPGLSAPVRLIEPSLALADGLSRLGTYAHGEVGTGRARGGYFYYAVAYPHEGFAVVAAPVSLSHGRLLVAATEERTRKYNLAKTYEAAYAPLSASRDSSSRVARTGCAELDQGGLPASLGAAGFGTCCD